MHFAICIGGRRQLGLTAIAMEATRAGQRDGLGELHWVGGVTLLLNVATVPPGPLLVVGGAVPISWARHRYIGSVMALSTRKPPSSGFELASINKDSHGILLSKCLAYPLLGAGTCRHLSFGGGDGSRPGLNTSLLLGAAGIKQ